ncbi:alpha/beta hydrolase [Chryseobacterium sp. T16E-39]|uniref:alpha/beta fold hydrolase n=1 Tax=Chryseobacterium sp. T16E-39 TaxID=2015076 RepID=UPI000B5B4886|nr:alpha/beta hydrolase [Chryseobacterium sp. T16E-39]ASK30677.1 alpha/beta hydrolase [Chryseobacterium sp. T16E-39]
MEKYAQSSDGQKIHYRESGKGNISIIFVHGWLGNVDWWTDQVDYLKNQFNIIQMDLAGHGKSDKSRQNWNSDQYAEDIKAVADQIQSQEIILVGHSMSGAYVLEAALKIPKLKGVILIDTIKDLDEQYTEEAVEEFLFVNYRNDFKNAVENILPQYLFAESTPAPVKERIQHEFLQSTGETAVELLKPLYQTDFRKAAAQINVPVRAINSDAQPTNIDANRKYLKDFDYVTIEGVGHYPMLEKPTEFNLILENVIKQLM